MNDDTPDYSALEPPDRKAPEDYTHHERRAAILRRLVEVGSPTGVTQARLAERYAVHESTISRDMDRLRVSVGEHLGTEAKFTTRTLYYHVVEELLDADDWKATKAAWDVAMDWNEWLAEIGEQRREPDRSEVDVDMRSRAVDVEYTVVREGDDELPTTADGSPDHTALGFTAAPAEPEEAGQEESDE